MFLRKTPLSVRGVLFYYEREKMRYRTRNMSEAAALLADDTIKTSYEGLEPTNKPNIFKFIIATEASQEDFDTWVGRYVNNEILVSPKRYDEQLNMLRDRVNIAKN
jgi:hypothetical protein